MRSNQFTIVSLALMLIGLVTLAPSAAAQVVYGQPTWGAGDVVYTYWNIDTDSTSASLSQVFIPISGFLPVQDNFEVQFFVGTESNSLEFATSDESVSGLTDLRLQANRSFLNDQLLLSGGLSLPTGKRELDPATEQPIIETLSNDFLEFPVRRFGEGFGFNVLASVARAFNEVRTGASLGYRFIGEYTAYENTGDYNPGDQITADARAFLPGDQVDYTAGIGLVLYTADQVDGKKVFEQGTQIDFYGSAVYHTESYRLGGDISYLIRGDNTEYGGNEIILSELQRFGNEFTLRGHAQFNLNDNFRLGPEAKLRLISESDARGSATVFSLGGGLARAIGEQFELNAGLKYYVGSAEGDDVDLNGVQISGGLNANF